MDKARILKALEAVKAARETMTDEQALTVPDLYKEWKADTAYAVGERLLYDGELYKVLQAHTSQSTWTPKDAPSLFAKVLAGQDGTAIGEWVQPDSTNPYKKGDRVTYQGKTWESTIDNNVWSPDTYGWVEVTV